MNGKLAIKNVHETHPVSIPSRFLTILILFLSFMASHRGSG